MTRPITTSLQAILTAFTLAFAALPASVHAAEPAQTPAVQTKAGQIGAVLKQFATALSLQEDDLWERIRDGFDLPAVSPRLVQQHQAWYLSRREHIAEISARSEPYLFHIVEEVEQRGMPTELALLPFIESAYNPQATSPQKAAGLWQMIPSTGRNYGLQQNAQYDSRRDVQNATRAALDLLQDLHLMFGRWDLALAAYNCGEGCVQRAIEANRKRGLSTAYEALPLPLETRHYVPKLIAVANIVRDADRYGVALAPIANEPYFMQVKLSQAMTPAAIAKLAEVEPHEFSRLNSGYRKSVIHADAPRPLLPSDSVATFYSNVQRMESGKAPLRVYRADKGETLSGIARKFGTSIDWLKRHNVLNSQSGQFKQPQTVLIPTHTPAKAPGKGQQAYQDSSRTAI